MAKENIVKMKRETTVWENIFANDSSYKGLIPFLLLLILRNVLLDNRKLHDALTQWCTANTLHTILNLPE